MKNSLILTVLSLSALSAATDSYASSEHIIRPARFMRGATSQERLALLDNA